MLKKQQGCHCTREEGTADPRRGHSPGWGSGLAAFPPGEAGHARAVAVRHPPQAAQLYGRCPVCRTRCFTSFLCMLNDFPHSSQVNTFSAVCVFLCSFRLLKLLNPGEAGTGGS